MNVDSTKHRFQNLGPSQAIGSPKITNKQNACRCSVALVVLLSTISAAAWAAPSRERLERELSAIELVPSREALLRHGPQVEALLREIVEQPSSRRLALNRALTVLRYFPSAATRTLLRGVIERQRQARRGVAILDLQQALISYAVVAGPAALDLTRALLTHAHPDVRRSAAEAVRLTRSPKRYELLEARLQVEPSAMVRHALKRELSLINIERQRQLRND